MPHPSSRFTRLLLAGTASVALGLGPTTANAQILEDVGDAVGDLTALLTLPAIDLGASMDDLQAQLRQHQSQLDQLQADPEGMTGDDLASTIETIEARIAVLELFTLPLPQYNPDAQGGPALQQQLDANQSALATHLSVADQAAEAGLAPDVTGPLDDRIAELSTRVQTLQGAIAAAEAPEPAPAVEPDPEPTPAPEPEPAPEPVPDPEPEPEPAPAPGPAQTPEPAPEPEPAPPPETPPEPAPAPEPAASAAVDEPAPVPAEPLPEAELQFDAAAALNNLPPIDYTMGPEGMQERLVEDRALLNAAQQAQAANVGDADTLAALVTELNFRLDVLEILSESVPAIDTDADRLQQVALYQQRIDAIAPVLAWARTNDRRDAGEALLARRTTIEERIAELQPPGAEPAPAPTPDPVPAPEPAPVPEPAPTPDPEPRPDLVPEAEAPAQEVNISQAELDTQIQTFLDRDPPAFDLEADVEGLRAQLDAYNTRRVRGEELLGQGRIAGGDVVPLAERMALLQQRIGALNVEITAQTRPENAVEEQPEDADVIQQLEAAGDEAGAEQVRALRDQLVAGLVQLGQQFVQPQPQQPGVSGAQQPQQSPEQFGIVVGVDQDRTVFLQGDQYQVRRSTTEEIDRLLYQADEVQVEDLGNGFARTTVIRADGTVIISVTDQYGRIIERRRIAPDGTETVLIADQENTQVAAFNPQDLPPLQITIPQQQYIVEADQVSQSEIAAALTAGPVETVERPYTVTEIRYNDRLRDKMRQVDLTTITFDFGSAAISPDQFDELGEIGRVLEEILAISPNEIFLIEGHADAVGSDYNNLILSDRRAETIAVALSQNFNIPPENLITQGYGEQFLKVPTLGPERQNRRGVILRITPLLIGSNAAG